MNMYDPSIPNMKSSVNQFIVLAENYGKEVRILDFLKLIRRRDITLVYCESVERARDLQGALTANSWSTEIILADTSDRDKTCSITRLNTGASQIVVTESRRLFGPYPLSIKYVVNYDFPHDLINYVERVNSCAPAGAVLTFFSERNERLAKGLVKLLEKIEYEIPDELYHLAKEYEKKESFYRNTSNGFLVPAPVRASFERPAPLRIAPRIPLGMRCNIDAFLNRQKLSSTISPSPHPLLALLPPPTEIIERQRELVALPDEKALAGSISNP